MGSSGRYGIDDILGKYTEVLEKEVFTPAVREVATRKQDLIAALTKTKSAEEAAAINNEIIEADNAILSMNNRMRTISRRVTRKG